MNENFTHFAPDVFCASEGFHRDKKILWIHFQHSPENIKTLRNSIKVKWSRTQKCWYISDTKTHRSFFGMPPKPIGTEVLHKISEINQPEFVKFTEQIILKGFSPNTQKTYCAEFGQFLVMLGNHFVANFSEERLRAYILYCHVTLKLSENQIHSRMNALKFYYEKVLGREKMFFNIPRPKKPQKLPKTLNASEISKLILATDNIKHRLILKLCYGMGLRVSEIVNLKLEHIDGTTKKVFIERAKGKKDRYVRLPESVLEEMRSYYKLYKPKNYLFEGKDHAQYAVRSAQQVFKKAMQKAGIEKTIGIHALRHSYATHLLEYGTDISLIQKLMGHNDIKTTLIYTHVSNKNIAKITSPLDRL